MKKSNDFLRNRLLPCLTAIFLFTTTSSPVSALSLTSITPIVPINPITPIVPINPAISDLQNSLNYDFTILGNEATITKYKGLGGAVTVPSTLGGVTVTEIAYVAFQENNKITSVVIPNSVTSIGSDAFHNCTNLKTVTLPDNLTQLGLDAFSGCSSLTSINIPSSLTSIEPWTFMDCTSLANIVIPSSITTIKGEAFSGCTSLSTITIPNSVTQLSGSTFSRCHNLMSINVASDNSSYTSVDGILYSKDKSELVRYPGGKPSASFNIPSHVKTILESAFSGDNKLQSVTIPNSVTEIGAYAFNHCALTDIKIPESVKVLGTAAFKGNINMINATIGNGVDSLNDTFSDCTKLKNVSIGTGVKSIQGTFSNCSSLTSINIPNGVTALYMHAFSGCTSLKGIALPYTITTLKQNIFYNSGVEKIWFYGNAPTVVPSTFSGVSKNIKLYYLAAKTGWSTPLWNGLPAEPFEPLKVLPLNPVLSSNPVLVNDSNVKIPTLPFLPFDPTLPTIPIPVTPNPTPTPIPTPIPTPLPIAPPPNSSIEIHLFLEQPGYHVNGQNFNMDTSPIIRDDRLLLPVRYIAEPLGAVALWNQQEQKVTVTMGSIVLELWIGNNTAKINGVDTMIDPNNPNVKPIIVPPGRTMLPLRFIGESLGCDVKWLQETQEAVLIKKPNYLDPQPEPPMR